MRYDDFSINAEGDQAVGKCYEGCGMLTAWRVEHDDRTDEVRFICKNCYARVSFSRWAVAMHIPPVGSTSVKKLALPPIGSTAAAALKTERPRIILLAYNHQIGALGTKIAGLRASDVHIVTGSLRHHRDLDYMIVDAGPDHPIPEMLMREASLKLRHRIGTIIT